jgi:hypothetical protein
MVQTVIVILLVLADVALARFNSPALQTPVTVSAPGMQATTISLFLLMLAFAGALVLVWLAGLIDRAALEQRMRRHERTVRATRDELLESRSAAYVADRSVTADVRARLDAVERDVAALRARIGDGPVRERMYPEVTAGDRRS